MVRVYPTIFAVHCDLLKVKEMREAMNVPTYAFRRCIKYSKKEKSSL
jgi:hypothetical protein